MSERHLGITHYQVLGIEPGAGEEDIRRAFRRMRALFDTDSVTIYGLYRDSDVEQEVVRLKRAVETLLDPMARQRYDQQLFGRRHAGSRTSDAPADPARRPQDDRPAERPAPRPSAIRPADPIAAAGLRPEDPIDGAALARIREACAIRLEEIAERTKISMFTLRSIEADQYDDLPAPVYLRGFLRQLATYLGLPTEKVIRNYIAAVEAWQASLARRR